jgi:glucan phosphoethanolaminetransferase (alkaline phosphatase superfamily)
MILLFILLVILVVSVIFCVGSVKADKIGITMASILAIAVSFTAFIAFFEQAVDRNRLERDTISEYYAMKEVLNSNLMETDNFYVQEKIYQKASGIDETIAIHKQHVDNIIFFGLYSRKIAELEPLNLQYSVNKEVIDK